MQPDSPSSDIVHAAALYRPLRRASRLARTSGTVVMTVGTVLIAGQALWTTLTWPAGCVLLLIGASEWRTGSRLLRADPHVPMRLALHQVAVFATVLLFALSHPFTVEESVPRTRALLAAMVLISAGIQSIAATYYLSRRRLLARFRNATDSWVRTLMGLETH